MYEFSLTITPYTIWIDRNKTIWKKKPKKKNKKQKQTNKQKTKNKKTNKKKKEIKKCQKRTKFFLVAIG